VLNADCGKTALEVWDKAAQPVDLLLTDMVMPNGISGGALAKTLLERSGDLKVIYMSGYSAEIVNNTELPNGIRNFLPKPFTADNLLSIVDSAIQPLADPGPMCSQAN
jgi:CheY-like chemotaxis protein